MNPKVLLLRSRFPIFSSFTRFVSFKSVKPLIRDDPAIPEFVYAGKNIKPHKRVYVMGTAIHGALGVKTFLRPLKRQRVIQAKNIPHLLHFPDVLEVEDIACGYGFTLFILKEKGAYHFYGTGTATNCQIGAHGQRKLEMLIQPSRIDLPLQRPSRQKKVACGRAHTIVWTDSEGLWTFGNNSYGQCGRPIVEDEDYSIRPYFHRVDLFNDRPIEQIECGQDTSFVVSEGQVYSCGWSADGQTGRETYDNVSSFGVVEGDLKGEKVVKVSCRSDCVLALTDKGDVFGWGNSEYRQLGSVTSEMQISIPRKLRLKVDGKVTDIAASGTSCFVVTDCGSLWGWGYGTVGAGPSQATTFEPTLIPSTLLGRNILNPDSKVTKVFAGMSDIAAVTNNGGLYTWGRNLGGCLGLGHLKFQYFPMRVCMASQVYKVSIGFDHMVVLGNSLI